MSSVREATPGQTLEPREARARPDARPIRPLLVLLALLASPLALSLVLAGLASIALGNVALSGWGWLWSIASIALGAALLTLASARARWAHLRRASVLGLAALALVRIALFGGDDAARLVVLDRDGALVSDARLVDRLFEERDASMVGSRFLVLTRAVPAREFPTLPALLEASYDATEHDVPHLGTPIPATLLGLQRADAFDAILVAPAAPASDVGVVFLHGFAGNFALQCVEVARVARSRGARTLCPSTRFAGDWWQGDGEAIVRASIAHLRAHGARRVVLVGLSNGGVGASRLAPRLGREIDALVLLSGVGGRAPSPRVPTLVVPTLVVQGDRDAMMSTHAVRAWARGRAHVRYVELPGTHFVLLEERARVAELLAAAFDADRWAMVSTGVEPAPRGFRIRRSTD
ncbi:MAG: hypothetical protein U0353_08810 [Sandaracinus sp.]